jgi:hypothetical protein
MNHPNDEGLSLGAPTAVPQMGHPDLLSWEGVRALHEFGPTSQNRDMGHPDFVGVQKKAMESGGHGRIGCALFLLGANLELGLARTF